MEWSPFQNGYWNRSWVSNVLEFVVRWQHLPFALAPNDPSVGCLCTVSCHSYHRPFHHCICLHLSAFSRCKWLPTFAITHSIKWSQFPFEVLRKWLCSPLLLCVIPFVYVIKLQVAPFMDSKNYSRQQGSGKDGWQPQHRSHALQNTF